MDPFTIFMILSGLGALNSSLQTNEQNLQSPAALGGGGGADPTFDSFMQNLAANAQGALPNLQGPTQAAGAAAQQTQAAADRAVGPPTAAEQAATKVQGPPEAPPAPAEAPVVPPSVGEILAAVPGALAAAGNILGVNDVSTVTQRPAPVAGGQPGQPVGQFARPFGATDIGQLLAALPGIR